MLNHGANPSMEDGKIWVSNRKSIFNNCKTLSPCLFKRTQRKMQTFEENGATSKNEIGIYSHLGLDQNLKKSIGLYTYEPI
jgi:hypothetical protein